ncbi:DUF3099 domain-containing protein [Nesterenkonia xinjiangensis]|uniref:DUF3099 domain-containing protein n=1 Tax=Nesterenkonia xinjiangensis TaxID=225327 RepID=A0A7Z0KBU6_9MICC|nr:hypothetical protein [Nesterenkonia xinjiangensis]
MNEQVHSITDAPQRHSEEQHGRMVRYAVSMGIRAVCFVLAVVVQNWMTWVFLALAVVLPYVAVTVANAGTDRYFRSRDAEGVSATPQLPSGTAQLGSVPSSESEDAADAAGDPRPEGDDHGPVQIIEGEVVRDDGDDGRP